MIRRAWIAAPLAMLAASPAAGQMGPNLDLSWSTIDGGGGVSTGGGFSLHGTIAQPDAGAMDGGVFQVAGGFWGGGGPPPCYPDCNASGTLNIADFGCYQTRFVAGDLYADCNGVGGLTIADFGCFQTRFVSGCP